MEECGPGEPALRALILDIYTHFRQARGSRHRIPARSGRTAAISSTFDQTRSAESAPLAVYDGDIAALRSGLPAGEARLLPGQPPPVGYYADNLKRVVGFLLSHRKEVFHPSEHRQLQRISELSRDASRLLARLLSRRGPVFLRRSIRYAEVADQAAAIAELSSVGLLANQHTVAADRVLERYLKRELVELLPPASQGAAKKLTKPALIESLCARYADAALRNRCERCASFVVLGAREFLRRLELCYFGTSGYWREPWSAFVLEDLGNTRFERYELASDVGQFPDRASLETYIALRRLRMSTAAALPARTALKHLLAGYGSAFSVRTVERERQRWLLELGQALERAGRRVDALACLRCVGEHPGRERCVRLLHRSGRLQARDRLLERMRQTPLGRDEAQFAARFPGRFPKLPTQTTVWTCEPWIATGVERFCADQLVANGGLAWHLENRLPRLLFGLLYWDALFAPVPGAFVHPFQRAPMDVGWSDFYGRRRRLFERLREQALAHGPRWLEKSWRDHVGTTNAFVGWSLAEKAVLEVLLAAIPMSALVAIADVVARDPAQSKIGFPDLTVVYAPGCFEFVEVKGPGDQLQSGQRLWLRALAEAQIPARVLRVRLQTSSRDCTEQSASKQAKEHAKGHANEHA